MKKKSAISLYFAVIIIMFYADYVSAADRRILGPNFTSSWASDKLAIESGSVTVKNSSSWDYATAPGWFVDYLLTPYISLRTNWFFYPTMFQHSPADIGKANGRVPLHEIGFSVLRHFDAGELNPWFGAGPFLQFASIDDINSYVVHAIISVGFDYEITEDIFFCPELMFGVGARIISQSANDNLQIDVPTGRGFSSSGIVIFLKIGFGKSF